MNGVVYHGSSIKDLDVIKSNISSHNIKCIYASDNIAVAMMFMGKTNDLQTLKAIVNKVPILVERKEGILQEVYNNPGYIYLLPSETFSHQTFLWKPEMISTKEFIKPISIIKFDNILESLKEQAKQGNLNLYFYPDRPSYVPIDNSDLIKIYINYEKKGIKGAVHKLLLEYPEFTSEVENIISNEDNSLKLNIK